MSDRDEAAQRVAEIVSAGFTDEAMKSMKKHVDHFLLDIEGDLEYRLKEQLADVLGGHVVDMAGRAITAILEGNDAGLRQALSCQEGWWTGRSDSPEYGRKREPHEWHSVIHGKLFEQGAVALRKKVVEAHRDLLVNQRILYLEDQVRSLVAQVNKAEAEKNGMWERLHSVGGE